MTIAAIYARKSKITEKGDSIENQIKLCKQNLEILNITDYIIYKDEGYSGKNIDRPAFLKLLEDAKQKKFNVLICYKLDRVSRSVADFSDLVNKLEKLDISLISVNEQFDTSSPMGRAMMYICSVFAQLERETISQRIRDNMCGLAESGIWLGGEVSTGYTSKRVHYSDEGGKEKSYCILSPVFEEIELVKMIYSKYLQFKSLYKLQKYMLTNNIKTKNGNDWSRTMLSSILTNVTYARADSNVLSYLKSLGANVLGETDSVHGILIYNKKKGKNGKTRNIQDWIYAVSAHEGIIESSDWLTVQQLIQKNRIKAPTQGTSHTALLSGIIRCSKCKSPMNVAYAKQYSMQGKKRYYYVCSLKASSGKTRCTNRNIDGAALDDILLDKLKEISIDKNTLISEFNKYKSEIENSTESIEYKSMLQQIHQNEVMIENLLNNVSITTDKDTAELFINKITKIKEETNSLRNKLSAIEEAAASQDKLTTNFNELIKLISNLSSIIDSASIEEKRDLISSVIEKVYADGDTGRIELVFKGVDA
jgi:site-specific DNA recombinase